MAPKKRPTKRLTGSGAAKASATTPGDAGSDPAAALVAAPAAAGDCVLPPDPEDKRLTLQGLVLGGDGKVDVIAYEDLVPAFASEPPPDQHPDPEKPGVRRGERVPKGLRVWDDIRAGNSDKDGAGWIAVRSASQHEKKTEKWFNIRTCGSWRMAFLLARLQRLYWDQRAAWLKETAAPVGSGATAGVGAEEQAAAEPAGAAAADGGAAAATASGPGDGDVADDGEPPASTPPPKAKRARAAAAEDGEASRKAPRRGAGQRQQAAKASGAEKKPPAAPVPAQGGKAATLIGADMLAGSVRLQQILAARQQQQQQQPQP